MKLYFALFVSVISVLFFSSCGKKEDSSNRGFQSSDKIKIATTSTMVTDLVQIIGGDQVEVVALIEPGVDPHSYRSRLSDAKILKDADIIFYSGLHLEGTLQGSFEERAAKGGKVYAVTDGIPEGKLLSPAEDDFPGHHDPHVWGDPSLWKYCAQEVAAKLALFDNDETNDAKYQQRMMDYTSQLDELHSWATQRVSELPSNQRVLVTSHDAFFYLGRAYGFEVRGLQGLSSAIEANLKSRRELVDYIRSKNLKMIFPESSVNAKGIASVAEEAGCGISQSHLFSDSAGEPGDIVKVNGESYDKGSYIGMVKHNINSIVDGLK